MSPRGSCIYRPHTDDRIIGYTHNVIKHSITGLNDPQPLLKTKLVTEAKKKKKDKQLIRPWSQFPADGQAGRWKVTQSQKRRGDECTDTSFKSGLWFWFLFRTVHYFFLLPSLPDFLMSVFILHVTVWSCAPSDGDLYTPVHITEPTPSVLAPSISLSSHLTFSSDGCRVRVQFAVHFKLCVPASCQCSIFASQRGRLLLSSDAHSTFSRVHSVYPSPCLPLVLCGFLFSV